MKFLVLRIIGTVMLLLNIVYCAIRNTFLYHDTQTYTIFTLTSTIIKAFAIGLFWGL